MSKHLQPFVILALSVVVASPGMAADSRGFAGTTGLLFASSEAGARGLEEVRIAGITGSSIAHMNRVLWESSFDRGVARHGDPGPLRAPMTTPAADIAAFGGTQHAGLRVNFPMAMFHEDNPGGLARRPGIGACLLAALAIMALAVSRRRTGYQPIVPPRLSMEARTPSDGDR